jgi:hypothetical protein
MVYEPPRSRAARAAAERALVRIVHHYGGIPDFVLLGGLMPEYLCSSSDLTHAGTTDVDVQVDLEIAAGSANGERLERALRAAGFKPDNSTVWRWSSTELDARTMVKFELLADLEDQPTEVTVRFDSSPSLGAVNLRGTGFASRDVEKKELRAEVDNLERQVEIYVTGLAGFLMAKTAAARARRKPKDWYDIAFVLLHNDKGGPEAAARAVLERFGPPKGPSRTAINELAGNFSGSRDQGPQAYASQMMIDHPDSDHPTLATDAVLAVRAFRNTVLAV